MRLKRFPALEVGNVLYVDLAVVLGGDIHVLVIGVVGLGRLVLFGLLLLLFSAFHALDRLLVLLGNDVIAEQPFEQCRSYF